MDISLDAQIRELIDNAPQDGTTPLLMEAIAPALMELAGRLRHLQYFVAQTLDGSWAVTLLSHETIPNLQKQIIYAYPTLKDVASGPYPMHEPQMIALPLPVTHILFQMAAMETIDSIIFFETPGNTTIGTEIQRTDLQSLIQTRLQHQIVPPQVPPDIA
jgi:hypothetical protein